MDFLEIDKLSAFYGKAEALHEVSLSVKQGEIIAIVGANGAGKSTFLDSIMGLTKTEGDIRLEGKSLIGNSTPKIVQSGVYMTIYWLVLLLLGMILTIILRLWRIYSQD